MLQTLKKFFDFCGEDNRRMFIASIWLGVVSAICSAMRIPAAAIVIQALLERNVTDEKLWEYRSQLKMKLDAISILRRAESKMRRDYVMGGDVRFGERRKFFAGAITPGGIKSNVTSVIEGVGRVVVLDVPVGSRTEVLLGPVSRRLTEAGFDVEEYYCPMSPERKMEQVVCEGADLAVICSNE